jgi:hypothetical protein
MDQFIVWLVSFMTAVAPPGRPQYIEEAKETKEEALLRYESIAEDIATVVTTEEPLFRGPEGRLRTATVIMSVMIWESGYRKDVDTGIGKLARGDRGNSVCLMQLNVGKKRTIAWNLKEDRTPRWGDNPEDIHPGWSADELLADRKVCIQGGLRTLRMSFRSCGRLPVTEWLRAYASGSCEDGSKESNIRMGTALRWYSSHRPDFTDADLLPPPAEPDQPLTVAVLD